MKKTVQIFSLFVLMLPMTSCVNPDSGGGGSGSLSSTPPGGDGGTVAPPTATDESPLKLNIFTIYDQTENVYTQTFAETGTTTCEATDSNPNVTCTLNIPEARLYFSKMKFAYSWRNDKCKLLIFQPYYYQIDDGTVGSIIPPWTTSPIDCTQRPISAGCFGGAAPYMVNDFPKYTAIIHLSDPDSTTPQQAVQELKSAYSRQYASNRGAANDIDPTKTGASFNFGTGDRYLKNTYTDYTFICRDDWYDPVNYSITLHVKDVDTSAAGPDDFYTWKEIP